MMCDMLWQLGPYCVVGRNVKLEDGRVSFEARGCDAVVLCGEVVMVI